MVSHKKAFADKWVMLFIRVWKVEKSTSWIFQHPPERLSFLPSFELKVRWAEAAQMSSQAVGTVSPSWAVVWEQRKSKVCILSADTTHKQWGGDGLGLSFLKTSKCPQEKESGGKRQTERDMANHPSSPLLWNNSKLWVERITSKTTLETFSNIICAKSDNDIWMWTTNWILTLYSILICSKHTHTHTHTHCTVTHTHTWCTSITRTHTHTSHALSMRLSQGW